MRILFVLLLSLLLDNCVLAQDSVYYYVLWTPTLVYKNAKVRQDNVFVFQNGKTRFKDSSLLQQTLYDSLGRVLQQENYVNSRRSNLLQNFYSDYLDSSVEVVFPSNKITRTYYLFDKNGKLTTKQEFITPSDVVRWRYVYNESNQLVSIHKRIGNNTEHPAAIYEYLSNRLIDKIHFFDSNGKEDRRYLYKYENKADVVTKLSIQSPYNPPNLALVRTYSKSGELLKRETLINEDRTYPFGGHHTETVSVIEEFHYSANGLLKEKTTTKEGEILSIQKHFYDE